MTWVEIIGDFVSARSVQPVTERTFRRGDVVLMHRVGDDWWSNHDIDAALIIPGGAAVEAKPQPLGTCWWCLEPIWSNKTFGYAHGRSRDARTSCCNGTHRADPGPGHGP